VRVLLFTFTLAFSASTLAAGQFPTKPEETFKARAEARAAGGVATTMLTIHVERYTTDNERQAALTALQTGASAALTAALRKTPSIGFVEVGDRRWAIRYARQEATSTGRHIVIVLDQPIFFLGGGEPNARPRDGFDLAAIQFDLDATGIGQGTLAAAARIEAGGPSGVELTDYSKDPISLVTIAKITS
jgi:hypothetical protein